MAPVSARAPQFAELTGAYWLEPIYAGLAQEWSSQGRTVPGRVDGPWQIMADGRREPGGTDWPGHLG